MRNFYTEDKTLRRLLEEKLPADFFEYADRNLEEFGRLCAGPIDERAVHTDREGEPKLVRYDKMGNEVSRVWLNEGYRKTIQETYDTGIVGYLHKEIPELGRIGNYVYAFSQGYLLSHAEPGFYCPVTLSKATAYLIDRYADARLKEKFLPHVLSTGEVELYEGATFLTERQGGSDVGANEVEAVKTGDHYEISGEKYFASNVGACGVAMVLARIDGAQAGTRGLSLFLVPWEENRQKGKLRIRRLKDKLGVRAVPSGEVEFEGAKGYLVGEAERGFYYMMEALNLSRVSNAVASLGIMKRAYLEARNYAMEREAFGNKLTAYPMVKETLSNLAAKQEVELQALFEVIELMDRVMGTERNASAEEELLFRLYVAIMKKESAEQAIHFAHEAIEMHGGNGYIEDFVTPRLLRDAQVLTVWEGTANILGLEVLRLIGKYNADEIFSEELSGRLDGVADSAWKDKVKAELDKLEKQINQVKKLSPEMQTYYTKRLAEGMAAVFESVVALEMTDHGNNRQKAVSEVFLHSVWEHDAIVETPPAIAKFEEINR
ncbi:acyl-CoA dehydrogenase family protein [Virgibacillus sp. YIM 98842]|uniref:acyl-CoA dehydrogenase family protein n=1 Tax=Virgibacillus sp. YIM 98842 TaxID=2663533 RepID=UPI0013D92485|nr:acyl-CoA dehydrogenase family protein [Virgibacillus sp. YIM 98842]